MKRNVSLILVFLGWILVIPTNLISQTIIYQSAFDNIPDSTMLGTNAAYAKLKNDGWRVNDSTVQLTEASLVYCFSLFRPKDEYRNAWTVTDAWHWEPFTPLSNTIFAKELEPIGGAGNKDLCICGYWGATGTTSFEAETCKYGLETDIVYGAMSYFTDLTTNRWAYRVVPTNGDSNITVSFLWRCNGTASYEQDYGQVGYSLDGGVTWTWLTTGGTANGQYYGQATVNQSATLDLPAACANQSNLAIGFGFICAGKGTDQDIIDGGYPGFAIDNLVVRGVPHCTGVKITSQPTSTSACNPGTARFSVTATGDGTISYQWQVSPGWKNMVNNGMYSGATTATLKVTNPTATLQYRCMVSNCSPVKYATSNAATLTLKSPSIISQPANTSACTTASANFSVSATEVTSYQWQVDNGRWSNINGATLSTLTVTNPTATLQYRCIITSDCTPPTYVTSNAATLTLETPVKVNPSFYDKSLCPSSSLSLTLSPTSGTAPYNYQWLLDGIPILQATNSLYYNSSISYRDSGTYSCRISNVCNSVTGKVVHLTVPNCNITHHSISGNVTYDNSTKTPMSSETANTATNIYFYNEAGDTIIATTQTDKNGNYEFVNLANGIYWVSGNSAKPWGGSNPIDALLVNKVYIHSLIITDALWYDAALVSGDKTPSPIDALEINRRYINLIANFPTVSNWLFQKIQVAMAGADLTQNIEAECYGDVNGSFVPPLLESRVIYSLVKSSGTINISSGQLFEIPVYLNDNVELGAMGIKLKVKSEKLKVTGVKSDLKGLIYNIENSEEGRVMGEEGKMNNEQLVNIAWSATDNGINVTPDKPLFVVSCSLLVDNKSLSSNQLPTPSFQLSSESVLADIDVNLISTDKLEMPEIAMSDEPRAMSLSCYPNPSNSSLVISYSLLEKGSVNIKLYDITGRKVDDIVNEKQAVGEHRLIYNVADLKSGVYFIKFTNDKVAEVKKIIRN